MPKADVLSETTKVDDFRIVEIPVEKEHGLTVIRNRVPADIDPEDIPENARLLTVEESVAIAKRAATPDIIRVGDRVRRRPEAADDTVKEEDQGFVDAILKSKTETNDKYVRVKWERSNQSRKEDPTKLLKIW